MRRFGRLLVDDVFLFIAVVTLIAGTGLMLVNIPYAYLQQQVEAGLQEPPPNFIQTLEQDEKTQDAAVVLVATAIFAVKFSFLFFFRPLLPLTRKWYMYWWWLIFLLLIPSALMVMFVDFASCPYFGDAILSKIDPPLPDGLLVRDRLTDFRSQMHHACCASSRERPVDHIRRS